MARQRLMVAALLFGLSLWAAPALLAQEDGQANPEDDDAVVDMLVGDIQSFDVNKLNRVAVANPEVADIAEAHANKVLVVGKRAGDTALFLWDADGKRTIELRVVKEDLKVVETRMRKLLNEANIKGVVVDENPEAGKVVLSGTVLKDDKLRLEKIVDPYIDTVLNVVKEEKSEDLVQVDMQIIEINTSFEKDLGISWTTSNSPNSSGSNNTSNPNSTSPGSINSQGSTNPGLITENENLPSTNGNGKFSDFFKIGGFARTPLQATINAFIQEGKARLISKPRLVALSGKQASFLVGGEIPLETTTSNTTGTTLTQNTSFTQYGVNVMVTPTITEGKIDVLLNVDIRDIDAANSSNGSPAFITRTASTNLFLDNKQTVVLAGLIKYSENQLVSRVPFLSDVPILGALFRNRNTPTPDTDTEMVIVLTPTVLTDRHFSHDQIVMPTASERTSWNEVIASKYEHEPLSSVWPSSPSKPQGPAEEVLPAVTNYARLVQEKISRSILYPSGLGGPLTGTVKLKLHILRDGSLDSEEVTETSGSNVLDQDALQAARNAAPFDSFFSGMDQMDMFFTIPIVYNRQQGEAPPEKVIASY